MTINKIFLNTLQSYYRDLEITSQMWRDIWNRFLKEPEDGFVWTEQDIWEQCRIYITSFPHAFEKPICSKSDKERIYNDTEKIPF